MLAEPTLLFADRVGLGRRRAFVPSLFQLLDQGVHFVLQLLVRCFGDGSFGDHDPILPACAVREESEEFTNSTLLPIPLGAGAKSLGGSNADQSFAREDVEAEILA